MNKKLRNKHQNGTTVIHVYPSSSHKGGGGATKINTLVCKILIENGYHVISVLPWSSNCNDLATDLETIGSEVHLFPMALSTVSYSTNKKDWLKKLKLYIKLILSFYTSLRISLMLAMRKDSILLHGGGNILVGYLGAKLLKRRLYVHVHEFIGLNKGLSLRYLFPKHQKAYFSYATKIICVSDAINSYMKKQYPDSKTTTLTNCLTETKSSYFDDKKLILNGLTIKLILIAGFSKNKGQLQAIDALYELKKKGYKEIKLFLIGPYHMSDDYYIQVLKKIKQHKLEDSVSIEDYTEDPIPKFKEADIALTCSELESFGLTTLEAAACGCFVIGSNTGATKDLVLKLSGLVYEYGNSVDLAEKIQYVIENKIYFQSIQNKMINQIFEDFSIENYKDRLLKIISQF